MEDEISKMAFLKLMEDPTFDSWVKASQIIKKMLTQSAQLTYTFQDNIKINIKKINNLLMLFYIYSLNLSLSYAYQYHYREQFIAIKKKFNYQMLQQWVSKQNQEVKQLTYNLVVQFGSKFLCQKIETVKVQDLQFLLIYFNRFTIKKEKDIAIAIDYINNLQQLKISEIVQFQNKELIIIRKTCQILESSENGTGNMNLVFDQYLIGSSSQRNIYKFCNLYNQYIISIPEQRLLKIFKELCKTSINASIVTFIIYISKLLAQEEQFYKLRYIYAQFILPNIVRRAKACTKERVEISVLQLGELYVQGFIIHCDIAQVGIQCILADVENVTSENYRKRWVRLALLVANKNKSLPLVERLLKQKKFPVETINNYKIIEQPKEFWEITTRNIRKHKVYKQFKTGYKGIINKSSQCYIISVVQALFMTKSLSALLCETKKGATRGIDQLKELFQSLKDNTNSLPQVNYLKRYGPKEFSKSQTQQDAQQYLLSLLSHIQKQLGQQNDKLLNKFKSIFQIQCKFTINCKQCKYHTQTLQQEYVHTISHKEQFQLISTQDVSDFNCNDCKGNMCSKQTQILLKNEIFIVHINRFSVFQGKTKKELPTQKILRKIKNYDLVGMIFHIGKNMQCGHYVYYSKQDSRRWIEFNDTVVMGFDLEIDNECFEREMKGEKTPYILFYKRNKSNI